MKASMGKFHIIAAPSEEGHVLSIKASSDFFDSDFVNRAGKLLLGVSPEKWGLLLKTTKKIDGLISVDVNIYNTEYTFEFHEDIHVSNARRAVFSFMIDNFYEGPP